MKNKKPTGDNGIVRVQFGGNVSPVSSFVKVKPPEDKANIEELFAKRFLKGVKIKKWFKKFETTDLVPNQEKDLDFVVSFTDSEMYLELMEIAPLDYFKTDFKNAPNLYYDYDFAKYIFEKIVVKSNKYKSIMDKPICLLVYVTDWKFLLSNTVISLLQYWLLINRHIFAEIYYLTYTSDDLDDLFLMYPTDREYFKDFDENKYKKNITCLPDPGGWKSNLD